MCARTHTQANTDQKRNPNRSRRGSLRFRFGRRSTLQAEMCARRPPLRLSHRLHRPTREPCIRVPPNLAHTCQNEAPSGPRSAPPPPGERLPEPTLPQRDPGTARVGAQRLADFHQQLPLGGAAGSRRARPLHGMAQARKLRCEAVVGRGAAMPRALLSDTRGFDNGARDCGRLLLSRSKPARKHERKPASAKERSP